MNDPLTPLQSYLDKRKDQGRLRQLQSYGVTQQGRTLRDGRLMLNFSSNDYLGLAHHSALVERSNAWAAEWGVGSTASRLVCGTLDLHTQVERKIADAKGSEAALIFNSGFQGNFTILSALLDEKVWGRPVLAFCDKLNHASMHQGVQGAGVRQLRYRHNDLSHLESLLEKSADQEAVRFIITESIFSMDGDASDIDTLVALARRYGAFLYVDEAHATGMMGANGFGLCAGKDVDFKMGTFSKAIGGFGAYIACSNLVREYLINRAEGFIYSTALPPAVLGAVDAAFDLIPDLDEERARVRAYADQLRECAASMGLDSAGSTSQIVPLVIGAEADTLTFAQKLYDQGIMGIAIRPPTVPANASRIRLAVSAAHQPSDIDDLCHAIKKACS